MLPSGLLGGGESCVNAVHFQAFDGNGWGKLLEQGGDDVLQVAYRFRNSSDAQIGSTALFS